MAAEQTPQVPWNEVQTQWRRNLMQHLAQSLEFKMLMHQVTDVSVLEERFGLVVTKVQDSVVVNLKEDC